MVTNSFGNWNFMQPMGRLSMHSRMIQFFSFRGGGGGQWFLFFFPCSHEVSKVFPDHSQFVPNSTWVLSPKFNSPVYKLKRWKGAHLFLFCNWGPKRCFYWGPMFQNICWWANQYGSFKIKKKVVSTSMIKLIWITLYLVVSIVVK
jgi:hypothetical protein